MINILLILLSSGIGGFLYWAGGHGKPYNNIYRDLGIPLLSLGLLSLISGFHWTLLLSCLLMLGALSTYWKIINRLLHKDMNTSYWFNYLAHGFGIGLSLIPYAIHLHIIPITIIRAIVLGLSMMTWSLFINSKYNKVIINKEWDERGRGALIFLVKLIK